ncbi:hypothetical protein JKP88DRAFT_318275 [Tribonema minus]|uniref:Uncharacterized protein n=1 Tax=Tribonema minus TaxID=303371 RepID=A0A836CEL4_9STRA|nr:hypothetical protein JKP88DRAFT_318275 [Tribonema minus]
MLQRANHYARSEKGIAKAIHLAGGISKAPWLVGPSFETGGYQLKLQLVTSTILHPGPHGLTKLHRAGCQVGNEDKQLEAVLQGGNGVFRLEKVHREVGADPVGYGPADSRMRLKALNGVAVTVVNPGQVLAVSGAVAHGELWRRENAADFVLDPAIRRAEVLEVSGELYRTWALSILNEQKEAARRTANDEYRDACTALAGEHTRTCDVEVLTDYYTTFAEHEDGIYDELLHPARSVQRFIRFSARQRAVARVAEVMAPAVVWQLACRTVIIMVPEAFTTIRCPGCGQRTQPGGEQHGHRNRVCNLPHRVCPIQAAANGGKQGLMVFNRNRSGGTNMGMRGVCAVCGVEDIIPGYPWMGPEGERNE